MFKLIKYIHLALLTAVAFSACSSTPSDTETGSSWETIPVTSPALRVTGRADWSKKDQVSISWSGSAFTIGFEGTALKIELDATYNLFDVFVDGETLPSKVIDRSKPLYESEEIIVVEGLPEGSHFVRIQRNTEINYGKNTLKSIKVQGKASPSALPAMPQKKIEFIGNSITCGLGILNKENDPAGFLSEDHFYSYAGQAARLLDAEEHCVCFSGKGITRNFDASTTQLIPDIYGKLSLQSETSWNPSDWVPDLIFINLGTNDFNLGIPDSSDFVNAVIHFTKQLREYYPKAHITLLDGPMMTGEPLAYCRKYLNAAQEALDLDGDKNVHRFSFDTQGELGYAIGNHPNVAQGQKDGTSLAEWVKKQFHWEKE